MTHRALRQSYIIGSPDAVIAVVAIRLQVDPPRKVHPKLVAARVRTKNITRDLNVVRPAAADHIMTDKRVVAAGTPITIIGQRTARRIVQKNPWVQSTVRRVNTQRQNIASKRLKRPPVHVPRTIDTP